MKIMRSLCRNLLLSLFILLLSGGWGEAQPNKLRAMATVFSDVPADYWAYPYIMAIYDGGLTAGCAAGLFCPEDAVTREEMAIFLLKALNDVPADGYCGSTAPFSDVAANWWSCKYIKRLDELGITSGYGGGIFGRGTR